MVFHCFHQAEIDGKEKEAEEQTKVKILEKCFNEIWEDEKEKLQNPSKPSRIYKNVRGWPQYVDN